MIENPKNANISNKVKTNSGSIVLPFCFMPPPVVLVCSQFGLNSVILAQRCVSPVQCSVLDFSSAVSVWMEVSSWSWVWFWSGRVGGQMRVSWCQRLDGRMLSTFSMMKFRGANSVLRNCSETKKKPMKRHVWRMNQHLHSVSLVTKHFMTLPLENTIVWISCLLFENEVINLFHSRGRQQANSIYKVPYIKVKLSTVPQLFPAINCNKHCFV